MKNKGKRLKINIRVYTSIQLRNGYIFCLIEIHTIAI